MKTLKFLLQKEFTQIRRNKFMARVIVLVPIVQMLILVPAVTFDIKEIHLGVIDMDQSTASRSLISNLAGSSFFKIKHASFSDTEADLAMQRGDVDLVLKIPTEFAHNLATGRLAPIQLLINGINGSLAQTTMSYFTGVIQAFNKQITIENLNLASLAQASRIVTRTRFWYNENLDYKIYMAPGILAILVTAIGFLLSGLNLVREKEIGTSEQINVTPIKKHQFILGKMIPFMVIGIIDLAFGLLLARLIYGMPFEGSLLTLFGFTLIYLIAVMGLGLFLSTFANTQQQYLFICFFFMMIFVLMSGIFTPAESMPGWAQQINHLNPAAYFIRVIRMIALKGSGFADIRLDILGLSLLAISTTVLASTRYKKTN